MFKSSCITFFTGFCCQAAYQLVMGDVFSDIVGFHFKYEFGFVLYNAEYQQQPLSLVVNAVCHVAFDLYDMQKFGRHR